MRAVCAAIKRTRRNNYGGPCAPADLPDSSSAASILWAIIEVKNQRFVPPHPDQLNDQPV
jgi:hypothetical protein